MVKRRSAALRLTTALALTTSMCPVTAFAVEAEDEVIAEAAESAETETAGVEVVSDVEEDSEVVEEDAAGESAAPSSSDEVQSEYEALSEIDEGQLDAIATRENESEVLQPVLEQEGDDEQSVEAGSFTYGGVTYAFRDHVLTIEGDGAGEMPSYAFNSPDDAFSSDPEAAALAKEWFPEIRRIEVRGVKAVGNYSFKEAPALVEVVLGPGVQSVGMNAFYQAPLLESADMASSDIAEIGNSAFSGCASLASVSLPSSLASIGKMAFQGTALSGTFVFPASLTTLGANAFRDADLLEGFEHLGYGSLTADQIAAIEAKLPRELKLKAALAGTPAGCFPSGDGGSEGGEEIPSEPDPEVSQDVVFSFDGQNKFYWEVDGQNSIKLRYFPSNKSKTLETVASVGSDSAGMVQSALKAAVKEVGAGQIIQLSFEDGIENIPLEFKLGYLGLNSNVTPILLPNLTKIVIPSSVKSIGATAFSNITKLTDVVFAEGSNLKSIGAAAFTGTALGSSSTGTFDLSNTQIEELGTQKNSSFFPDTLSYDQIIFPTTLKTLGDSAFANVQIPENSVIKLPETVTKIGDAVFRLSTSQRSQINQVVLPASVESVSPYFLSNTTTSNSDMGYTTANLATVDVRMPSQWTAQTAFTHLDLDGEIVKTLSFDSYDLRGVLPSASKESYTYEEVADPAFVTQMLAPVSLGELGNTFVQAYALAEGTAGESVDDVTIEGIVNGTQRVERGLYLMVTNAHGYETMLGIDHLLNGAGEDGALVDAQGLMDKLANNDIPEVEGKEFAGWSWAVKLPGSMSSIEGNPTIEHIKSGMMTIVPVWKDIVKEEPATPVVPEKPVDPIKPTDPTTPSDPVKPADPVTPVKPSQPEQSANPAVPAKPSSPHGGTSGTTSPTASNPTTAQSGPRTISVNTGGTASAVRPGSGAAAGNTQNAAGVAGAAGAANAAGGQETAATTAGAAGPAASSSAGAGTARASETAIADASTPMAPGSNGVEFYGAESAESFPWMWILIPSVVVALAVGGAGGYVWGGRRTKRDEE